MRKQQRKALGNLNPSIVPSPVNETLPIDQETVMTQHQVDGSRFWAVLIGIDAYKYQPLRGCVSDTKKMDEYLTKKLGVPEDHIRYLLSTRFKPRTVLRSTLIGTTVTYVERFLDYCFHIAPKTKPTRDNITDTLLHLSTDTRIQKDDNIIIYFSGHGSAFNCSSHPPYKGTNAGTGSIEAICPIDRSGSVPDISDREINVILAEVARTKGHQITFILDCCRSSGATRAGGEGVRMIQMLPYVSDSAQIQNMFDAADRNLGHLPGYKSISAGDWHPTVDSHVALAACAEHKFAEEKLIEGGDFHGVFTLALVSTLMVTDLSNESVNYASLMKSLPRHKRQNPVVCGTHMNARLWYQDSNGSAVSSAE